jgi:hypothetical protein
MINKIKIAHDIRRPRKKCPSQAIVDRINEYNREFKAAYKKRAQDTYAAHLRTLKDKKSINQFCQLFTRPTVKLAASRDPKFGTPGTFH